MSAGIRVTFSRQDEGPQCEVSGGVGHDPVLQIAGRAALIRHERSRGSQSSLDPIDQGLEFPADRFMQVLDEGFVEVVDDNQLHDVGEVFVGAAEIAQAAGELRLDQCREVQDRQAFDRRDGSRIRGVWKNRRLTCARALSGDDEPHGDARVRSEFRGGCGELQPGTLEDGTDPDLIFRADQEIDVDRMTTISVQADRHPPHDRMGDRLTGERLVDLLGTLPE